MTKSIRTLEMQGPQGKIKITLEGPIVKHFLSIAQILEQFLNDDTHDTKTNKTIQTTQKSSNETNSKDVSSGISSVFENMTIIDRLKHLIRATLKMGWANSREIKELYEYHFQATVSLSTISTYLKRLSEEGIIEKRGSKTSLEYRLNPLWYDQIPELELPRPRAAITTNVENATTRSVSTTTTNNTNHSSKTER